LWLAPEQIRILTESELGEVPLDAGVDKLGEEIRMKVL
jgi:hypothetical protein